MRGPMKRIGDQTYYEILEVNPKATTLEIRRAYDRIKKAFHRDSLAVYSLFGEDEIHEIQAAIEEAYQVLTDETLRGTYDQSHQRIVLEKKEESPKEKEIAKEIGKSPVSFDSIEAEGGVWSGKTLKQIREKMGIDLSAISMKTKITPKVLEAIEEERWETFPAAVYLKGFLKGYAQCLGLDPQKVAEAYLQFLEEKKKSAR
jgi:flagellar biosynthesis protein FlhG